MVRSIYLLAVFTQIVLSVSAQDYCANQCKDKPDDVVCTCVLCPKHTCEDGFKECEEENTVCTTIGLDEEKIRTKCLQKDPYCEASICFFFYNLAKLEEIFAFLGVYFTLFT